MTIDNKIRDENYHTILIEKQQKYQHYHQVKFINMNIPPDQSKMIEQAKFTYPLEKALSKQTKKIENQEKKQKDAIMNQNETQAVSF